MKKLSLPHIIEVGEDECLIDIKATGNDVFGILHCIVVTFLQCQVLPQVFLIVSQLDDEGDVKHILQPPRTRQGGGLLYFNSIWLT